jgi:gamma-glutamyltranspeptidase/glutathione hydrolase
VAADHPLASAAGTRVLADGGNAVDAAIAAALDSGVVQPSGSGLGGGGFAVVVRPNGEALVLDFRETAPGAATRDMYAGGASSTRGGLAVAVPSEGLGLVELHRKAGRISLAKVAAPAIGDAERGFETGKHLAESLLAAPDMASLFGEGNKRPALATALHALVDTDGEAFRSGWVAQDLVDATTAAGGILTMADLAAYQVKERKPLVGSWEGHTIVTMPPPSSGGVALLQMLGATEGTHDVHCDVEAAKHAMADRANFGGDPDFVTVDGAKLLAKERIAAFRADCGPATFPPEHYGAFATPDDHGTLHISVIDGDGMAVALTTTINTSFGSHVVAPKSGIVLNDEMDDFTTRPGQPNAFGLMQGENNAIAPGKRPLSSMTPTVVLDAEHRPELAIGASGGPWIITGTYQVLRRILEDHVAPELAVAAPRWHHQWQPNVVSVDAGFTPADALRQHGHEVKEAKNASAVQAVERLPDGTLLAGSDPRKYGQAAIVGR